ncbi:MAG: tRNA epoxyqueuosine(34) reductase QueG [Bacteroidetes bacterium]|nr:tRNA epoxyqueuosine(34) reductase QueG [Bacteroidota bacterium]
MINGKASRLIKDEALKHGFAYCGIAKAQAMDEDARRLEAWLKQSYHGEMKYMENHFEKRTDPRKLVDGAKSVITLLCNYFPQTPQPEGLPKISRYAYGQDYHEVLRPKLNAILTSLRNQFGDIQGRGFVDSAPVLERSWALRSGLGWIGKNGNLITKQQGSYFFIATLIVDIELEYDDILSKDYCGTCTKCIDACPTEAILPNKQINGSQCISYYTIELKNAFNETMPQWNDWIFGCDICMEVCPWNRFSIPHNEPAFTPLPEILSHSESDWMEITEETFKIVFKDSPIKRTKYAGFMRNVHHKLS